MSIIIFVLTFIFANEDGKEISYTKSPKSLFLIKKAKVESDVGEPIVPLFEKQKQNLLRDERFTLNDN